MVLVGRMLRFPSFVQNAITKHRSPLVFFLHISLVFSAHTYCASGIRSIRTVTAVSAFPARVDCLGSCTQPSACPTGTQLPYCMLTCMCMPRDVFSAILPSALGPIGLKSPGHAYVQTCIVGLETANLMPSLISGLTVGPPLVYRSQSVSRCTRDLTYHSCTSGCSARYDHHVCLPLVSQLQGDTAFPMPQTVLFDLPSMTREASPPSLQFTPFDPNPSALRPFSRPFLSARSRHPWHRPVHSCPV